MGKIKNIGLGIIIGLTCCSLLFYTFFESVFLKWYFKGLRYIPGAIEMYGMDRPWDYDCVKDAVDKDILRPSVASFAINLVPNGFFKTRPLLNQSLISGFHESGKPKFKFSVSEGKLHGISEILDFNGSHCCVESYNKGELNGLQIYFGNFNKILVTSFQDGKMIGPTVTITKGDVTKIEYFNNDGSKGKVEYNYK